MAPRVKAEVGSNGECPVTRATVRFGPSAAHTGAVSDSVRRVLVILAFILGLAGIGFACSKVDTDDGTDDIAVTDAGPVEQLIPPRGSEILRQEAVGVDLRPGWTGVLIINNEEIPEDQVDTANLAALGQLLYTAGDGKAVEHFEAGENCITAVVWRVEESRADSRNVDWCFNVT
jgi:hypothetical protein